MKDSIRNHSLVWYFALTFLLSWSVWVPLALDHYSLLPARLDPAVVLLGRLLGTLGPALAAILVSLLSGGKPAVSLLLGQLRRWKVGWKWYAAAGLVFPVLVFAAAALYRWLPGTRSLPFQAVSASNLIAVAVILTISVLGEEIGWRGFALPALQNRYPAVKSSLILGTVHTLWHLPFWIVLGELESYGAGYWLLSWAWILAITLYITWMMNNTRNSLPMVFLFHWSLNIITVGFLPITTIIPAYILLIVIGWILVLGITGAYRSKQSILEIAK